LKIKKKTKIEYIYKKLGINRKLPTATILVPTEEAITTIQALTIQPLTAITTTRPMPTTILASALHSNTNFRLYILRNIYSKGISIKEIYSFLNY